LRDSNQTNSSNRVLKIIPTIFKGRYQCNLPVTNQPINFSFHGRSCSNNKSFWVWEEVPMPQAPNLSTHSTSCTPQISSDPRPPWLKCMISHPLVNPQGTQEHRSRTSKLSSNSSSWLSLFQTYASLPCSPKKANKLQTTPLRSHSQ
jgi:hypothetical protein